MPTNKEIDELAQRLVNDDVLVCLSSLVGELNKLDGNTHIQMEYYDELLELGGSYDYESAAREHLATLQPDEVRQMLDEAGIEAPEAWGADDLIDETLDNLKLRDELRKFCDDNELEPDFSEAYEHWAVSGWLGGHLRAQGEVVVELFNMNIWARTTTGQMIYMDGVIQQIAADLLS